ncbi:MAG: hypothetical protein AB7O26_02730 [Planctomycetaceae bacterium]
MGQPLSGKAGELLVGANNLEQLTRWELEYGMETHVYAARSGGGAEETIAGVSGGRGSFELLYDPEEPFTSIASSGDLVSLKCRHTADGPVQAEGSARLGRFTFSANRDGTLQRITVPFICHGAWTFPSA